MDFAHQAAIDRELALKLQIQESRRSQRNKTQTPRYSHDSFPPHPTLRPSLSFLPTKNSSHGSSSRSTPSSHQSDIFKQSAASAASFYTIEDYIAYDHISHHVLVKFEGDFSSIEAKYEWQPSLSLIYNFSNMKDSGDLNKESLIHELTGRVRHHFVKNLESDGELNVECDDDELRDRLLILQLNPITDYGFEYHATTPFTGYIPAFSPFHHLESEDSAAYDDSEMLVYCVHPRGKPDQHMFGVTDYLSLKQVLLFRLYTSENPDYYLNIYNKMENFVESKRRNIHLRLIEMKRYQRSHSAEIPEPLCKQKLFDDLYKLMVGHEPHRLTDILDIQPLDPDRLRAYIDGQWGHDEGLSLHGGSFMTDQ